MEPKKAAKIGKEGKQTAQRMAALMVKIAEQRTEKLKDYKNAAAFNLKTGREEMERMARMFQLLKKEQKAAQLLEKKAREELETHAQALKAARELLGKIANTEEIKNADDWEGLTFAQLQSRGILETIKEKTGPALAKQEKTQKATEKAREQLAAILEELREEVNKQRKEYGRKFPAVASFGLN